MTVEAFKRTVTHCEAAHLLPRINGCVVVPLQPAVHLTVGYGKNIWVPGNEWHHAIGQTKAGRANDKRNILHVNHYVHEWITDNSNAGRVLTCMALRDAGRLDFAYLSKLSMRNYPWLFDTDPYIEACEPFAWLEELRVNLLMKAA